MSNEAITLLKRLIDDGIDAPSAHCPSPPPPPPPPPDGGGGGVRRIVRELEIEIEREIQREVERRAPTAPKLPRETGALHRLVEHA